MLRFIRFSFLALAFAGAFFIGDRTTMAQPQSELADTSCVHSYNVTQTLIFQGQYLASFDTSEAFIQRCPTNIYAPFALNDLATDLATGTIGPEPETGDALRQWLITALAWNPGNVNYFCSDMGAIMGTFSTDDTSWNAQDMVTNEGLSVLYWILHNPACNNSYDSLYYLEGRGSQYDDWLDRVDTSKVPLDTTIYTLHQLGLDSILKYAALLGVSSGTPSIITNPSAYPNPTGTGTVISFGIAREAYVLVQLFDVLGHEVSAQEFGSVVEPGNHEVPFSPLANLPSGTYFARIQTTFGETQSIKIVKQ